MEKNCDMEKLHSSNEAQTTKLDNILISQNVNLLIPGKDVDKTNSKNNVVKCRIFAAKKKEEKKKICAFGRLKRPKIILKTLHPSSKIILESKKEPISDPCTSTKEIKTVSNTEKETGASFQSTCTLLPKLSTNFKNTIDNSPVNSLTNVPVIETDYSNENEYKNKGLHDSQDSLVTASKGETTDSRKFTPLKRVTLPSFVNSDTGTSMDNIFLGAHKAQSNLPMFNDMSCSSKEFPNKIYFTSKNFLEPKGQTVISPVADLSVTVPYYNEESTVLCGEVTEFSLPSEEDLAKLHSAYLKLQQTQESCSETRANSPKISDKSDASEEKLKDANSFVTIQNSRNKINILKSFLDRDKPYPEFSDEFSKMRTCSSNLNNNNNNYIPQLECLISDEKSTSINMGTQKNKYNDDQEVFDKSADLILNSENDIPMSNEVIIESIEGSSDEENTYQLDEIRTNTTETINENSCIWSNEYSSCLPDRFKEGGKSTTSNGRKNIDSKAYFYNHSSPLSFLVQNVLENIFKHESHPSSANMAKLAKLLYVQWKDIKDWFVAKRLYLKKIGYSPRNQPLDNCAYCPLSILGNKNQPMIHLLSKIHIENIMQKLKSDCPDFAREATFQENILTYSMTSSTSIESFKILTKHTKNKFKLPNYSGTSKLSAEYNSELKNVIITTKEKLKNYKANRHRSTVITQEFSGKEILDNSNNFIDKELNCREISDKSNKYSDKELKSKEITDYCNQLSDSEIFDNSKKLSDKELKRSKISDNSKKFFYKEVPLSNINLHGESTNIAITKDTVSNNHRILKTSNNCPIFVGFRCPICEIIFKNEWMLIKHSLSHRKFICSDCEEVFETEHLLQCHLKKHLIESIKIESIPLFICNKCRRLDCVCPKISFPATNTTDSLQSENSKCHVQFLTSVGINDHLRVTIDEVISEFGLKNKKSSKCSPKNDMQYSHGLQDVKQSEHGNTYTDFVTFNCNECESFFFSSCELKKHLTLKHIKERNGKIETNEDELHDISQADLKSNFQSVPMYILCSYCFACFEKEYQLRRHLRYKCLAVPIKLTNLLYNSDLFKIAAERKGKHYYTLNKNLDGNHGYEDADILQLCNICNIKVDKTKYAIHEKFCGGNSDVTKTTFEKKKFIQNCSVKSTSKIVRKPNKNSVKIFKRKVVGSNLHVAYCYDEINSNYIHKKSDKLNSYDSIFICCYCEVPFSTHSSVYYHLLNACQNRQKISNSTFLKEKDYLVIKKCNFIEYYYQEGNDYIHLKQLLDFKLCKSNKRVICKFCSKIIYRMNIFVHLIKFCQKLSKELKNLIKIKKLFIKSYLTRRYHVAFLDGEDLNLNIETKDSNVSLGMKGTGHIHNTGTKSSFGYDCHLCEEKFSLSNNFIEHLYEKHNLKIEDNSAFKWLSREGLNDMNYEEDHILDQEINLSNIAEVMHVTDNILDQTENVIKVCVGQQCSSINRSERINVSMDTSWQGKTALPEFISSQNFDVHKRNYKEGVSDPVNVFDHKTVSVEEECKNYDLEDSDLLVDDDNLESFIETVQLSDTNFESSLLT